MITAPFAWTFPRGCTEHFDVDDDAAMATVPDIALALVRLHAAFVKLRPFRTDAATVVNHCGMF